MNKPHLTDMSGEWDTVVQTGQLWSILVKIPEIGSYASYKDQAYEIISTRTYQEQPEQSGGKPTFTTFVKLQPISDEGDDISGPDNPSIEVKAVELDGMI